MKKDLIKWFVILICCFILSTFLHEIAHGISAYTVGAHVSTGFNKVGQAYKYPKDIDFRKGLEGYQNPLDMGPTTTLILAIGFTLALSLFNTKNKITTMIIGGFALSNSLIRLIPMIISYFRFITKGAFSMEDEIGTGLLWYKLSSLEVMKYIPSLISIMVSLICLHFVINALKSKLPFLFSKGSNFTVVCSIVYIISFVIENGLDNVIRINWI